MNRVARHEAGKRTAKIHQLISDGRSAQEAESLLAAEDRRDQAALWLHVILFEEEYDHINDSHADAKDRARGISPMDSEYQVNIAGKRAALKVPPLNSAGNVSGNETHELCKKLVAGIAERL